MKRTDEFKPIVILCCVKNDFRLCLSLVGARARPHPPAAALSLWCTLINLCSTQLNVFRSQFLMNILSAIEHSKKYFSLPFANFCHFITSTKHTLNECNVLVLVWGESWGG
jgi:hypothetical protein